MKYKIKFRRNTHEAYWNYKETDTLFWFQDLIDKLFDKTDLDNMEIIIRVEKNNSPLKR